MVEQAHHLAGMVHVDMRKLPAAAQEERRRQVVGLRESRLTFAAIAAQTGLTENGVSGICRCYTDRGLAGLVSGPRGPASGPGRFLKPQQEAEIGGLICRHLPDARGLSYALWSRAAVRMLVEQRCGVPTSSRRRRCSAGCGTTSRPSQHGPSGKRAPSSGATRPACARMTCVAAALRRAAARQWCVHHRGEPGWA